MNLPASGGRAPLPPADEPDVNPWLPDEHAHGSDGEKQPEAPNEDQKRLCEQARALRESSAALELFDDTAVNPGEQQPKGGKNHIAVAEYVLSEADSPWVGIWAKDQRKFQRRILAHELAHGLHRTSAENRKLIDEFLAVRWKPNAARFEQLNRAWRKRKAQLKKDLTSPGFSPEQDAVAKSRSGEIRARERAVKRDAAQPDGDTHRRLDQDRAELESWIADGAR